MPKFLNYPEKVLPEFKYRNLIYYQKAKLHYARKSTESGYAKMILKLMGLQQISKIWKFQFNLIDRQKMIF